MMTIALGPSANGLAHADDGDRRRLARIGAGIALSLMAHAALLAIYRQPAAPALPAAAPEPLTVRLRPLPPPAPPVATEQPSLRTPPTPVPAPRARHAGHPSAAVIAVAPEQRPSNAADNFTIKPAPETPPPVAAASTAPRFDADAARKFARTLADAPDPAKAGTALERLPPPPLQTETRLERAIGAAKRPDCKDGVPGGLLAPLFLAMDKKDSGCKW